MLDSQLPALKADIAANTATIPAGQPWTGIYAGQQINALPNTGDANAAIAGWYNQTATPDYIVWRDLPMEKVLDTITFASMTPADTVPTVTALGSNPTVAQNATYNNQMATLNTWRARSLSCQGKQFNLQNLTIGRTTAPMKKTNYRAAMQDCLTNSPAGASGANIAANWVGVRDSAKFTANRIEKLLATGTGTTATPADLSHEGTISGDQVEAARNLP
jgi:hypothetical protein